MAGTRARRARCGRRRARMAAARARAPARPHPRLPRARLRPWGVQRPACRPSSTWAASGPAPGESRGPAAPAAPAGPGACSGESGTRPGTRRVPARGSGRRPRGSRIDDVTSGRIAPGGLARIERRRIVSRWARTARGGMDCVALGSHYASRVRPAPAPASPGIGLCRSESRRGSGRGGGEGYSGVVLKTWSVKVVVMVRSDESSSSEGLLQRRPSASPECDARGR